MGRKLCKDPDFMDLFLVVVQTDQSLVLERLQCDITS